MKNLMINQNKITVNLNKKFYKKESVLQTINDFQEACQTEIKEGPEHFSITLNPLEETNNKKLALEFANYCLSMNH